MKGIRDNVKDKNRIAVIGFYLLCILYITLWSRSYNLVPRIKFVPFWSLLKWIGGSRGNGKSIILNIMLFIPLGYLLAGICKKKWTPVLLSFVFSLSIELIQYFAMHGTADADDLVFNSVGAALGTALYWILPQSGDKKAVLICIALGLAGSMYTTLKDMSPVYERQFYFDAVLEDTTLYGHCYFIDGETPKYTIIINDKTVTEEKDKEFIAEAAENGEIYVKFMGHQPISTGVYIRDGEIKYTSEDIKIEGVPDNWKLMVWNKKYDTLIYQDNDRLIWMIGTDINQKTEVIYHIYTDEPLRLPENRKIYGFDNRGFRIGSGNELEKIGHYRVFVKKIPQEYNVTSIIVGFNPGGIVTWREGLRPVKMADLNAGELMF